MAFEVHCDKCNARFTLPDDLFERKVKGRVVTVRCRKCQADISVNGMKLSSKPPASPPLDLTPTAPIAKPLDLTPTVPLTRPQPKPKGGAPYDGLWLVSYGDDDDRELSVAQIKAALRKGEIDGQTIVWNARMDDWKPIAELPELGGSSDAVGGFLGTGANVTSVLLEPGSRDSGAPPPTPGKEEADILGDDELGPFRSVSAGTLGFDDDASPISVEPIVSADFEKPQPPRVELRKPVVEAKKAEPKKPPPPRREPPKREAPISTPPPKPKVLPQAPKRLQPDWLSEAKPEDDEAPPSSQGTPNLKDLTVFAPKAAAEAVTETKPTQEEDILGVGGGGLMAGIDLSNLPPAPVSSRPPPTVEAEADAKEETAPRSRRSRSKRPSGAPKSDRAAARAQSERPAPKSEAKKEDSRSAGMIWLVAAGLGVVAIWWLFFRPPTNKPAEPAPNSASEPTPARSVESPQPEKTAEAVPPPTPGDADASAPPSQPTAEKKEPTAEKKEPTAEKKEPTETKEPSEKKEPVATTTKEEPSDVDMAPPFDKAAAVAALNSAAGAASSCRQEGDPSGTATVVVTFAPSGRATNANLTGPPFAGTKTGGCIAAAMRRAKIPAFSGSHMTVSKTVIIQ